MVLAYPLEYDGFMTNPSENHDPVVDDSEIVEAELMGVNPFMQPATPEPVSEFITSPFDSDSESNTTRNGSPDVDSNSNNGVVADSVPTDGLDVEIIDYKDQPNLADQPKPRKKKRSWVFRCFDFFSWIASRLFGICSVVFMLAVAANIPIVQFLSYGYLLEVTGRLARKRPMRESLIGLQKSTRVGSYLLGTWLCLIPVRLISKFSYDAFLIDPSSQQTTFMRALLLVGFAGTILHVTMAWVCGGKLRYFFWPIVAPFSFAVWISRKFAGAAWFRKILKVTVGWMSPHLVDDICNAKPISDWFVPAIVFNRMRSGELYTSARDGFWTFVASLNLMYYLKFGLKGFIGTLIWLIIPTALLVASTSWEGPAAVLAGLFGVAYAIPVFAMLPFLQAHFAVDGRLSRFWEIKQVWKNIGRAPLAHLIGLLLMLVFALPLFLTKIEQIPTELLWSLSLVFIVFTWPAKWIIGWAYRRGAQRDRPVRWWVRYPVSLVAFPLTLIFTAILFFSRYITWNGATSLIENHVFLLPAPFWLDWFLNAIW